MKVICEWKTSPQSYDEMMLAIVFMMKCTKTTLSTSSNEGWLRISTTDRQPVEMLKVFKSFLCARSQILHQGSPTLTSTFAPFNWELKRPMGYKFIFKNEIILPKIWVNTYLPFSRYTLTTIAMHKRSRPYLYVCTPTYLIDICSQFPFLIETLTA